MFPADGLAKTLPRTIHSVCKFARFLRRQAFEDCIDDYIRPACRFVRSRSVVPISEWSFFWQRATCKIQRVAYLPLEFVQSPQLGAYKQSTDQAVQCAC